MDRKMICILGAESTGTRIFTDLLSQHSCIQGTVKASSHIDWLDKVWRSIEDESVSQAVSIFKESASEEVKYFLTRRSMPHSKGVGQSADFMEFPNLEKFCSFCDEVSLQPIFLITTRSTVANLSSWQEKRASSKKSMQLAATQYKAAYEKIFSLVIARKISFSFLSLEALLLDKQDYLNSIFALLDLPPEKVKFRINQRVNKVYYRNLSGKKFFLFNDD